MCGMWLAGRTRGDEGDPVEGSFVRMQARAGGAAASRDSSTLYLGICDWNSREFEPYAMVLAQLKADL